MTINLENGRKIVINAPNSSERNKYISSATFNGKLYNNNWLSHAALLQGGVINFDLSAEPNKQRGTAASSFPYSLSNDK